MKQSVLIVIVIEIETLFPQFNKIDKIELVKILSASYFRKELTTTTFLVLSCFSETVTCSFIDRTQGISKITLISLEEYCYICDCCLCSKQLFGIPVLSDY